MTSPAWCCGTACLRGVTPLRLAEAAGRGGAVVHLWGPGRAVGVEPRGAHVEAEFRGAVDESKTRGSVNRLLDMGCGFGQGFYLGPPMPFPELVARCADGPPAA
jgi:hypothetical protein